MIRQALLMACRAHAGQTRKDGKPYIVHPVEVALELARNGADEELICAGLLHDAIEDGGMRREELSQSLSPHVAALVAHESEDKSQSWEVRKNAALDALRVAGREQQMLMCADKLANLRDMRQGLDEVGEAVWSRFKRGRAQQAWLFHETAEALAPLKGLAMYEEFSALTEEIFPRKDETEV